MSPCSRWPPCAALWPPCTRARPRQCRAAAASWRRSCARSPWCPRSRRAGWCWCCGTCPRPRTRTARRGGTSACTPTCIPWNIAGNSNQLTSSRISIMRSLDIIFSLLVSKLPIYHSFADRASLFETYQESSWQQNWILNRIGMEPYYFSKRTRRICSSNISFTHFG